MIRLGTLARSMQDDEELAAYEQVRLRVRVSRRGCSMSAPSINQSMCSIVEAVPKACMTA